MSLDSWLAALSSVASDPDSALQSVRIDDTHGDGASTCLRLTFVAADLRGQEYTAEAKVVVPAASSSQSWLWFNCGYELADLEIVRHTSAGRTVVTSVDPGEEDVFPFQNPLCRGPNTDLVLAHIVRRLACVDPLRIVYGGGSAGGYAALMVAAEAFPVGAAIANAPVVNLAYQAAYTMRNAPALAANPPREHPMVGVLMAMFVPFVERGWKRGYGDDLSAPVWLDHSPIAHLSRITCPTAAFFSTADFLVPVQQVSRAWADASGPGPEGVVVEPSVLSPSANAELALLDLLGDSAEVHVVNVPRGARVACFDNLDLTLGTPHAPVEIPVAVGNGWSVTILDEGPVTFGCGHTKHEVQPSFDSYITDALSSPPSVDQLTEAKLRQLIQRHSGTEWLAPGFHHLDRPAAERSDVATGLRTYCRISPAHARHFEALYAALAPEEQALAADLVRELTSFAGAAT